MCGFTTCNQLDANSSFLIENKDDEVKRSGSLWLCQKPSFDVGYSVPLRRTGVNLIRQISSTNGKKIWTVENEEEDDEEEEMIDYNTGKPAIRQENVCFQSSMPSLSYIVHLI